MLRRMMMGLIVLAWGAALDRATGACAVLPDRPGSSSRGSSTASITSAVSRPRAPTCASTAGAGPRQGAQECLRSSTGGWSQPR